MRIESLHLIAFGPFTNTVIDLSGGNEGLHIIYGPNESGKSSSLRALHQVLYGIPAKSGDNFKHAHSDMRIGAVLKHSDGSLLKLLRRKGNSKTLRKLDSENELIDAQELHRYIGSINQSTFEHMFGIDHATLVTGGEAILKGSGELGQLLFSAGAGITDLRSVLAGLEKDYQDLYTRTGTTRAINKQLADYSEAKKTLKESELPSSQWEKHEQSLKQFLKRKADLDKQIADYQKQIEYIKRYLCAIPIISERNLYIAQLAELGEPALLSDNFEDDSRQLLEKLHILRREQEQTDLRLAQISGELAHLQVPAGFIERCAAIESLLQQLGSHQKAAIDRLNLELALVEEQERARACLIDLGRKDDFDSASRLRMSVQEKTRLRKLALEKRALWQAFADAQALRQKTELRLKQASQDLVKLEKIPACENLLLCMKRIQQDPQSEERLIADANKLERSWKQLNLDLGKLKVQGLKESYDLSQISELHAHLHNKELPDLQCLDDFEKNFESLRKEIETLENKQSEISGELMELRCRLQEHDLKSSPPTEADLSKVRQLRQNGWKLVLKSWKENLENAEEICRFSQELGHEDKELALLYESCCTKADSLADRLRREADSVAEKIQLSAHIQKLESAKESLDAKLALKAAEQMSLKSEWDMLWAEICARQLSPVSAKSWLNQFSTLIKSLDALVENLETLNFKKKQVEKTKLELRNAILEAGWVLSCDQSMLLNLLEQSQQCLDNYRHLQQLQNELEKEISRLQIDLANNSATEQTRKAELDSWAASWHPAVESLGLGATTSPEELTAFLDRLDQFFSHYDQLSNLKRRIAAIVRDSEEFRLRVSRTIESIKAEQKENPGNLKIPNFSAMSSEEAAAQLYALLKDAKEIAQKRSFLKKQNEHLINENQERSEQIDLLSHKLTQMIDEAGVASESELITAARKSQRKKRLLELVDNYDRQLARLSEGESLSKFLADVQKFNTGDLEEELRQHESALQEAEKARDEVQQQIGSEKQILNAMDGSAKAADAAGKVQQILAEMSVNVEQYCRLRIATVMLKKAIERYREKNQSPILRTASQLFSRLSAGSFSGLAEDFNEKGEAALFGLRPDGGTLVPIEGMSEGSCDQVYLAIRLAGLYLYLDKEEPLPFIVDDILVNFDDSRSAATLKVLSELSERTQIIMFTHHEHILELAEKHLDKSKLFIRDLHGFREKNESSFRRDRVLESPDSIAKSALSM